MKSDASRRCVSHPDREARWTCAKFSVAYCDECCGCPYPEGYCTFRPQCPIWQICLEQDKETASSGLRASEGHPQRTHS
jgi:hypothetical protein